MQNVILRVILSRNAKSTYHLLSTFTSLRAFECRHMAVTEDFTMRMFYHSVRMSIKEAYVSKTTKKDIH